MQSSECKVWLDGAGKKRKRDFEGEQISKHVKTLADRNRHESKRLKTLLPNLEGASGLSSDDGRAEIEHSGPEETSIGAFKRIRFDTGLQALAIEELIKLIDLKRDQIPYSDVQLRELIQQMRPKRSKWVDDLQLGREESYEATEALHECRVCGKLFKRSYNWKLHMETHNPERKYPHPCTAMVGNAPCTKKFQRKTDLDRHYDSVSIAFALYYEPQTKAVTDTSESA